jgi:hypothetical protein
MAEHYTTDELSDLVRRHTKEALLRDIAANGPRQSVSNDGTEILRAGPGFGVGQLRRSVEFDTALMVAAWLDVDSDGPQPTQDDVDTAYEALARLTDALAAGPTAAAWPERTADETTDHARVRLIAEGITPTVGRLYYPINLSDEPEPGTVRIVVTLGRLTGEPTEAHAIERALVDRLVGGTYGENVADTPLVIEPRHFDLMESQEPTGATFGLVGTYLEASDEDLI